MDRSNCRKVRESRGLSCSRLSELTGVSVQVLRNFEDGKTGNWSEDRVKQMSDIYDKIDSSNVRSYSNGNALELSWTDVDGRAQREALPSGSTAKAIGKRIGLYVR